MRPPPDLPPISDDELRTDLSVILAVGSWHVPVLQGRDAPKDPRERDRKRRDFAVWLIAKLRERGYHFYFDPPESH